MSQYAEFVRGTVIGAIQFPYEFWTVDGKTRIAKGYFKDDHDAEEWLREYYRAEYRRGVDMRCFYQA